VAARLADHAASPVGAWIAERPSRVRGVSILTAPLGISGADRHRGVVGGDARRRRSGRPWNPPGPGRRTRREGRPIIAEVQLSLSHNCPSRQRGSRNCRNRRRVSSRADPLKALEVAHFRWLAAGRRSYSKSRGVYAPCVGGSAFELAERNANVNSIGHAPAARVPRSASLLRHIPHSRSGLPPT